MMRCAARFLVGIALIGAGEIDIMIGSIFGMEALTCLWLVVRVDPQRRGAWCRGAR